MPYTTQQFAAEIKRKYPEYASWPDDHLVSEVVKKHPEYQSWLSGGSTPLTTMDDLSAQKGPVRRFAESAVQTLNPVPLAKKLLTPETYTEPFTTMAKVPDDIRKGNYLDAVEHGTRLVPTMTGETIGQRIGKARATGDAARRGDTGEAISRSIGALPGGGAAEGVIDQARSGDVAGAAGTVTGLVLGPKAVGATLGAGSRLAPMLRRGAAADAVSAADATPKGQPLSVRIGENQRLRVGSRNRPANADGYIDLRGKGTNVTESPGRIIGKGIAKAAVSQVVRATGIPFAGEIAAGTQALKTIAELSKTPAWNNASAAAKSNLAEFVSNGRYAEGAELIARTVGLSNASQDPRQRYIDHLIGGGSAP